MYTYMHYVYIYIYMYRYVCITIYIYIYIYAYTYIHTYPGATMFEQAPQLQHLTEQSNINVRVISCVFV